MKNQILIGLALLFLLSPVTTKSQESNPEAIDNQSSEAQNAPVGQVADEQKIFEGLRNGVLTVKGDTAIGAGFFVDQRGIVLTSREVIRNSKIIRVQSASRVKVEARLLAEDSSNEIAALWVNSQAFPQIVALPLAKPNSGGVVIAQGERVLAIGIPLEREAVPLFNAGFRSDLPNEPFYSHIKMAGYHTGSSIQEKAGPALVAGIATSVQPKRILCQLNSTGLGDGGPLFNLRGEVVGLVHPGGSIRVEEIERLLVSARQKMVSTAAPSSQLIPVEPEARFPVSALADLAGTMSSRKFDRGPYEFWAVKNLIGGNPKYRVMVVTPVFAWYLAEAFRIDVARRMEKDSRKAGLPSDSTQLQWNWTNYEGKLPAVVRLFVYPQATETRGSLFKRNLTGGFSGVDAKFKTSFDEAVLLCDGKEAPPIDRIKSPVAVPEKYAAKEGALAFKGDYTYSIETFDPNRCQQLELKIISEGDPSKPDVETIPSKTVQRVWADFEGYRRTTKGQ